MIAARTQRCWSLLFSLLLLSISPLFADDRPRVAVVDFQQTSGVKDDLAILLSELLRSDLYALGAFELLNREDMTTILQEIKFQQSGACDTSCVVEMGQALGVEKIVSGTIGKLGESYTVTVKLVDVATARNERLFTEYYEGPLSGLKDILKVAARRLVSPEEGTARPVEKPKRLVSPRLQRDPNQRIPGWKTPVLAWFLSALVPGAGQHYNGQYLKGFLFEAAFVAGIISSNQGTSSGNMIGLGLWSGSWVIGMIEAPMASSTINQNILKSQTTARIPLGHFSF